MLRLAPLAVAWLVLLLALVRRHGRPFRAVGDRRWHQAMRKVSRWEQDGPWSGLPVAEPWCTAPERNNVVRLPVQRPAVHDDLPAEVARHA